MAIADQKTVRFERASALAEDVIEECRMQLMLRFRFLDRALWRMPVEPVHVQARYPLATDGSQVYVCPEDEVARALSSVDEAVRDYLHLVLHCVFRHPFLKGRKRKDAWSLACDVTVEAQALELAGERFPSADDEARAQALSEMRLAAGALSPMKLYRLFEAVAIMPESEACRGVTEDKVSLWRVLFERDNHEAWPALAHEKSQEEPGPVEELPQPGDDGDDESDDVTMVQASGTDQSDDSGEERDQDEKPPSGDSPDAGTADDDGDEADASAEAQEAQSSDDEDAQADASANLPDDDADSQDAPDDRDKDDEAAEKSWEDIAKQMRVDLQTYSAAWGDKANDLVEALTVANRRHTDYGSFLRRFMTQTEELKINPDEFDYVFYTYGLKLYGNMPLIEPLEYADTTHIRTFVIAIDTSESCSGDVLRRFLERTFDILKEGEGFSSEINVHLVQCDARVQADTKIESLRQVPELMRGFYVRGGGGTDFRPVFAYVDRLRAEGELADLQGLIYFTDGLGTFPDKPPDYDTAFVFLDDGSPTVPRVPPWAAKAVIDDDSIGVVEPVVS